MLELSSIIDPKPSERRNTIASKALSELREAIITARIKPGASLAEADVAEALGISRTPVREAFARLFEEGLIEISPQTGTRVSLVDMARVREAVFIRSTLEGAVVAGGAGKLDAAALNELDELLRFQEVSKQRLDMAAVHRADMAFHAGLMRAFARPRAWAACQHVSADLMRVQFLIGLRPDHIDAILAEHREILDSLRQGEIQDAARLLAAHIERVDLDQIDLRAKHREFFASESAT